MRAQGHRPDRTARALGMLVLVLCAWPVAGLLLLAAGLPYETATLAYPILGLAIWFGVAHRPWRDLVVVDPGGAAGTRWALYACAAAFLVATAALVSVGLLASGGLDVSAPAPGEAAGAVLTTLLVAVLLTAIPEEIIYRGALLTLSRGLFPAAIVITGSAGLFAVAHLPNLLTQELGTSQVLLRLLELALFGALMGWSVIRTGSVWLALGWHSGSNAAHVGADLLLGLGTHSSQHLVRWFDLAVALVVVVLLSETARRRRGVGRVPT